MVHCNYGGDPECWEGAPGGELCRLAQMVCMCPRSLRREMERELKESFWDTPESRAAREARHPRVKWPIPGACSSHYPHRCVRRGCGPGHYANPKEGGGTGITTIHHCFLNSRSSFEVVEINRTTPWGTRGPREAGRPGRHAGGRLELGDSPAWLAPRVGRYRTIERCPEWSSGICPFMVGQGCLLWLVNFDFFGWSRLPFVVGQSCLLW